MKKPLILLLFGIIYTALLNAQTDKIAIGKITYSHQTELSAEKDLNGIAVLYFNTSYSRYIHQGVPPESYNQQIDEFNSVNISGDPEGFPVYKSHREKKMWTKIPCYLSKQGCIIVDTLGAINWEIHSNDKKVFGAYECLRATGSFGKREYEAWFTPDIPVMSGPYKLGGLPGLILEAKTLDNLVRFTFIKLELRTDFSETIAMPGGKNISMNYETFIKTRNEYVKNGEKDLRAKGYNVSMTPDINTIELVETN